MSARSLQWYEVEVVTRRTMKVRVNVITGDDLEGMTAADILEEAHSFRLEQPRDSIEVIGSCDEPEEYL